MYFPVVSHSPIRVKSAYLDETAPLHPGANETILVVDDEAAIRQLVSAFLTETGYHVLAALDSVSALKQADKTEHIDLLLTDIVMPETLNGISLRSTKLRLGNKCVGW